jgi:hypothetical protein
MGNFKVSGETVGKVAKGTVNLLVCTLAMALPALTKRDVSTNVKSNNDVNYDDVISTIMKSDMLSSYKVEAATMIPKDGADSLYRAVIQVINSDMLTSNKIEVIEHICEE